LYAVSISVGGNEGCVLFGISGSNFVIFSKVGANEGVCEGYDVLFTEYCEELIVGWLLGDSTVVDDGISDGSELPTRVVGDKIVCVG
jgi:hypothetical protein